MPADVGIGDRAAADEHFAVASAASRYDHTTAEGHAAFMVYFFVAEAKRGHGIRMARRSSAWARRRIQGQLRVMGILR